jgi:DNA-binding CsgD family transcriptional regulator
VIITDSEDQPRASADTLNALYGLTPAETTIANGLLSGLSPQEIADQRRVSIGTVRDQLKSLLSKTGTRRQSDLVRILAYTPRQNTNGA